MEYKGYGQGVISARGIFVKAICHPEEATVLTMYLYELRRVFFIYKWMLDMFRMLNWDNQKVEKCPRYAIWFTSMQYICLGDGAFPERGILGNAVYRSEDAPVLTMYLYELFSYWLLNLC